MSNRSSLTTLIDDAQTVITRPVDFYRNLAKTGGYADPVIFVIVMAAITGLVVGVLSIIGLGSPVGLAAIIIFPIFGLIGSFIGAAIMFVIWRLMGSAENYEAAYRCVAYASAIYPITTLLGILPYLGSIIAVLWGMYLMATASIETHQLAKKTTYLVFGILAAIFILLNLSAEVAQRQMSQKMEGMSEQFESLGKQFEHADEMTPEEAGEAFGRFMQGLQKATEQDK